MAEKLLNTRILLKYDSLTNWNDDLGYLRKGEVAIATVDTDEEVAAASKLTGGQPPQVLIKVGDGIHKFSELPYITAKAGDVYSWAKEKTLKYDALPKELKDKIVALEGAIGQDGSVQVQIENAIKALDVPDVAADNEFVVAVPQVDGKVAVERRKLAAADIPNIEEGQVNGLTKKLGDINTAIGEEATAREQAVQGAKTYAEGLVNALTAEGGAVKANADAIAEIKDGTNGILAQAKADATQKANDALAAAKTDATTKANTAESNAKDYVDEKVQEINGAASALEGRVAANEAAIGVINGAATEEGSLAKVAKDADDAVKAEAKRAGDKETELANAIADVKADVDAFFADADMTADAIDTLKELQAEIAADNTGAAAMAASIQQNKEAIEAEVKRATAKEGELGEAITKAVGDEAAAREQADNKHTQDIAGINTKIGAAAISNGKETLIEAINANSAAITAEKERAEGVEASLLEKIGTGDLPTGTTTLIGAINANAAAIADEATARDIADKQHTADIKAINDKVGTGTTTAGNTLIEAINANSAAIAAEEERALAAEAKALSDAKAYTDAEVKELADGQVKSNADAIAAINGNANIVKSVKFENVSGKTPVVLAGGIANNELTVKFDDTLTFILDSGNAASADQLDATAQG